MVLGDDVQLVSRAEVPLIGVGDAHSRIRVERRHTPLEERGSEHVVGVETHDVLRLGARHTGVARVGRMPRGRLTHEANRLIRLCRDQPLHHHRRIVGRAVVDHDHLEVA